jgi:hypothetical protein
VYTGGKSALVRITGVHASHQNVMDVVTFELNTYLRMINPDIEDIYFETEITQPNGVKLRSSTVYGDYQLYFDPYKGGRRFNQATMDEGFYISDRLSFGGR